MEKLEPRFYRFGNLAVKVDTVDEYFWKYFFLRKHRATCVGTSLSATAWVNEEAAIGRLMMKRYGHTATDTLPRITHKPQAIIGNSTIGAVVGAVAGAVFDLKAEEEPTDE